MTALVRAARPAQWVKNVFVVAPAVFAQELFATEVLGRTALAFLGFCLAASSVYLINDLRDREEDRLHPLKRHRPLASGELSPRFAVVGLLVAIAGAAGLAALLGLGYAGWIAIYVTINVAYSTWLKHVVIVDVMVVASGYVLRVLAGAAAIQVHVSRWLLLCTILLALFLILSKRRHEVTTLQGDAAGHRSVLSHYGPEFLDQMINVVTPAAVVAYALYAVDTSTVERFGTDALVWTVPLVLFGVFRYLYLTYQVRGAKNPTEEILTDVPSLVNLALWSGAVLWIVYGA